MNHDCSVLARFTLAEFRAFKRAVAVLVRSGVAYDDAVNLLVDARDNRKRWNLDTKRTA